MITAVVLTHNSDQTLEKTLQSIAWCDERIVVDDYSTDTTLAIAKKHRATLHQHHLNNDFASQRNFGLSKASGDWVLFVDSDEVISDELKKEILHAVVSTRTVGYFFKRQDYILGHRMRYGETQNVKLLRLAKKDAGVWERAVHEVWNVKGETGLLTSPILHYPHPTVRQFLDKINYYSSLNAEYLFRQNVHVSWWHIVVYPSAKFVRNYIFYAGFMDGTVGIIVALMMSFHSFLTRAKLYILWHPRPRTLV